MDRKEVGEEKQEEKREKGGQTVVGMQNKLHFFKRTRRHIKRVVNNLCHGMKIIDKGNCMHCDTKHFLLEDQDCAYNIIDEKKCGNEI